MTVTMRQLSGEAKHFFESNAAATTLAFESNKSHVALITSLAHVAAVSTYTLRSNLGRWLLP